MNLCENPIIPVENVQISIWDFYVRYCFFSVNGFILACVLTLSVIVCSFFLFWWLIARLASSSIITVAYYNTI